jgi:hypothetical protein
MRRVRLHFLAAAAACAATILTAGPALADAAPPYTPGDPVGVPSGAVQDVFIEHEDLSMDLSGLNPSNPHDRPIATILATYTLRNDGASKGIDLVFVTATREVRGVEVVLDGTAIAAQVGPLGPVPASWKGPRGTPDPEGGPDLYYPLNGAAGLAFHVELGAGRHTMGARYQARPTVNSGEALHAEPVRWQLAFVLSPARQWKGFGDLDVSVRVPSGWLAAVRPSLSRRGDVLTGHFDGIPADSVDLTAHMPQPPDYRGIAWDRGQLGVIVLSVIIGLVGAMLVRWPFQFAVFGATPIFPLFLAIVVNYGEYLRNTSIPYAQLSWFGVRGVPISSFVQVPYAVVIGFLLGLLGLTVGIAIGGAGRLIFHGLRAQRR